MACSTFTLAKAPYLQTDKPIKDEQGRIAVIVDFLPDAHESYPGVTPREIPLALEKGKFFHQPKVLNLIADYEKRYGFARTNITTWAGSSVTAFLDDKQVAALLSDRLVHQISQDSYSSLSASNPPWYNLNTGIETYSWGRFAVNGKVASPSSTRKIYVVDSGVALHTDLPNVTRTSVACSTGASAGCEAIIEPFSGKTPYPVSGCYSHATHVAGIIGAPLNNTGTVGVYAGAQMISLNVTQALNSTFNGDCSWPSIQQSHVGNALDYVMQQTLYGTQMAVVNISINSAGMGISSSGIPEPNWARVRAVATPAYRYDLGRQYHGAFVAQSAGNGARPINGVYPTIASDACLWNAIGVPSGYRPLSYAPYSVDYDGIMVVGAVNSYGRAVSSTEPFAPPLPAVSGTDPPSNYGRCIDVWAPGDAIYSTWGAVGSDTHSYSSYSNVIRNSGTSFAAPHVAAAAAYLADVEGLTTPAAVEQRIRQLSVQFYGYTDASGQPVKILQLP
jgi:hypothetical protein